MKKPKGLMASGICLLAIVLGTPVLGAGFDERLEAPRAISSQALQIRLQAHFETFDQKQQEPDPGAFIRDPAAHKQWADLYFSVIRALDEGVPLDDLAKYGLVVKADGTHSINLKQFPQWEPLDSRLFVLSNPAVFESTIPALKARGFADGDVDALRAYLAAHDPSVMTHEQASQLVHGFAQRLKLGKKTGRALNLQEVMTYRYQKSNIRAEAKRQWAIGLLDALDPQRQRILASLLEEFESELMFGKPAEPIDQTLEKEAQPLISGEYVQLLARDATQIRQDMTQRAEKLMGGQKQ
jgi:hypothetical protein